MSTDVAVDITYRNFIVIVCAEIILGEKDAIGDIYNLGVYSEEGFSASSMCAVQAKFELKEARRCKFFLIARICKKRVKLVINQK